MTTAGMSHLSAVSGSNVAIVLAAALGLARLAGFGADGVPWWRAPSLQDSSCWPVRSPASFGLRSWAWWA